MSGIMLKINIYSSLCFFNTYRPVISFAISFFFYIYCIYYMQTDIVMCLKKNSPQKCLFIVEYFQIKTLAFFLAFFKYIFLLPVL